MPNIHYFAFSLNIIQVFILAVTDATFAASRYRYHILTIKKTQNSTLITQISIGTNGLAHCPSPLQHSESVCKSLSEGHFCINLSQRKKEVIFL
jgi:hypothetical protein